MHVSGLGALFFAKGGAVFVFVGAAAVSKPVAVSMSASCRSFVPIKQNVGVSMWINWVSIGS